YAPEGKRVLDFGCMDGIFTLRLQQLGGEAVGYDISPAAIAQAKLFRGHAARPVFTTVPPGPGQFDRIYCNEVLEHVEDDSADRRAGGISGVGRVGGGYDTGGGGLLGSRPQAAVRRGDAQAGPGSVGPRAAAPPLPEPAAQLSADPPAGCGGVHL